MRSVLILCLLLFCTTPGHNQVQEKIDSLKQYISVECNLTNDRLVAINELLILTSNPDESLHYGQILIKESTILSNKKYLRRGFTAVGGGHSDLGNFDKALEAYIQSVNLARELKDQVAEGHSLLNVGGVYFEKSEYLLALSYNRQALKLFKQISHRRLIGKSYVRLGYLYYALKKYDYALHILDSADVHLENPDGYLVNLLQVYSKVPRLLSLAKLNRIEEAEALLLEVTNKFEAHKIFVELANVKVEMGKIYKELNRTNEAIILLTEGFSDAKKNGVKITAQNAAYHLSDIYMSLGDYKKALDYQTSYSSYRDSLVNADQIQKFADLRTEYEVGQKQAEVDLLTAEKKNQQIIIYATTGGGILILVMLGLVFKSNREKSKINKQLEEQKRQLESLNQTKDKFFSIISHDLRGPVSSFSGVSRLIKGALQTNDKEELLKVADEIDYSVDHLSGLLDNLLNWAMRQQGYFPNVPEKLELNQLIHTTTGLFSNMAESKSISLNVSSPEQLYIWGDQNSTMTILRNLTSNALKFTEEGGTVSIVASHHEDMATIEVADNGIGMTSEEVKNLFYLKGRKSAYGTAGEKGLGLGLQLVYEFVEMNNGTIEVESHMGIGTRFLVKLPLFDKVSEYSFA